MQSMRAWSEYLQYQRDEEEESDYYSEESESASTDVASPSSNVANEPEENWDID